jgi:hypothetical protein
MNWSFIRYTHRHELIGRPNIEIFGS